MPVGGDTGLDNIKAFAIEQEPPAASRTGERTTRDIYEGFCERVLRFIDPAEVAPLRVVLDGANGMAGPMITPLLEHLPIQAAAQQPGARRHVPEPRAEPAARGEPGVHHLPGAGGGRRPRHRLGRRRRPLLLHRRPGRVRARRLDHRADRRADAAVEPGRGDRLRPARLVGSTRHHRARRAAGRSRTASATPSSRPGSARRTRSSPARSPATTTSRTSTTATPGSSRRWCCWSSCREAGKPLSELLAPFRERYFISGEINSTVSDVPLKLQELKERYSPSAKPRLSPRRRSRSSSTTGTSTSGRRTPSRCCASTWRRSMQQTMEQRRDEVLALIRS